MNEEPKSIWKKSWTGWRALPILISLLVSAGFLAALAGSLFHFVNGKIFDLSFFVYWLIFTIGVIVTFLLVVGLFRFVRWLCCWQNIRRFLFGLACFATLIALFYAEEDWRGWHAWNQFKHQWEAKGEKFDFKDLVPPPVPADQNFALTPIVFSSYGQMLTRVGKEIPANQRDDKFVDRLEMPVVLNYADEPAERRWQLGESENHRFETVAGLLPQTGGHNEFLPGRATAANPGAGCIAALSRYDPTIEELRAASKLPYSRFPIEYDKDEPAAILLPHLAVMKECVRILRLRAMAELQNDESRKGIGRCEIDAVSDAIHRAPSRF